MNRIGWLLLLLFGAVIGGFLMLVRSGSDAPPPKKQVVRAVAPASSGLVIPVQGIAAGQLYDSFDEVRGEGRRHSAIDITAAIGTPVVAAAFGQVEKLFDSEAGGHTIYVRSPNGRLIYYYAHLDRYAEGLREGDLVARGQPIGTVGISGNADPNAPHLHFEIKQMAPGEAWYQGRAVNPYPLLAGNLPSR
jgi:murein DD-endopeptidase MepM/ murein hydrolase activator NlpD